MELVIISAIITGAIITGAIAEAIGRTKNRSGFWWGFFLSWLGIIVVACMQTNNDNNINKSYANKSKYEKLEQLQKLKEIKAITEQEFEKEKEKVLNRWE